MAWSPAAEQGQTRYQVDDITDKTRGRSSPPIFEEAGELTGYMKLKLWVEAGGSDDMDLFVALEKIDRTAGGPLPVLQLLGHRAGGSGLAPGVT